MSLHRMDRMGFRSSIKLSIQLSHSFWMKKFKINIKYFQQRDFDRLDWEEEKGEMC